MDSSYYIVYLLCKACEDVFYVCRYPDSFRLGLQEEKDEPAPAYTPWNNSSEAMAWARILTSQEDAESKITHLRSLIKQVYKEYGDNVPVTVFVKDASIHKVVGSYQYVPNPPH